MTTWSKISAIVVAFLGIMLLTGAGQLAAQEKSENHVMSVTRFEVPADEMAGFLELTRKANEIHEQVGSVAEVRVWSEVLAGEDFGTVIHTKEYPSFEAMAADYSLVHSTDEWQEFLKEFNASGATVISNSLQWELIP